jgi:SAM-dependent methyltransferase
MPDGEQTYDQFARVYDAVMDDARPKIARIRDFIARFHPAASSLLELGCGTGTMLAGLGAVGSLTGIDRSPQMLEIARSKVPTARLIEDDITSFELEQRFDVVICVFDTLNHLVDFEQWLALFNRAHTHLADGGLFIFDVNTLAKLHGVAEFAPWFDEIDSGTVIQSLEAPRDGLAIWNVWIVEDLGGGEYAGHHERIGELAIELEQIASALEHDFVLLEAHDEMGAPPTPSAFTSRSASARSPGRILKGSDHHA